MPRKNILFISSFFPNPAAPNIATYNRQQLTALTEHYEVDAVVPIPWTQRLLNRKIPYEGRLGKIDITYPTYFYTPLLLRERYGLYYRHCIRDAVAALASRKPYHLVYSSWLYPDGWVASRIARELGLPLFVSVLGSDVNRLQPGHFLAHRAREVAQSAQRIICVSRPLMQKLIEVGCPPQRLAYLQNGMDTGIFRPLDKEEARRETGLPLQEKVILFVGNLKKEKGLEELCRSFAALVQGELPDCRLAIIGGGRYRAKLQRLIVRLGVSQRAELLGERPPERIAQYLNACDLLCLPSYSEGEPNVVMEALACQTRVVATTVGGIPDLDDGHGSMRLVPPRDVPRLSEALRQTLTDTTRCELWRRFNTWNDNAARLRELFEAAG